MGEAKYLVIPGNVLSMSDGDTHYVTADRLIQLYGVDRSLCVVWPNDDRGWKAPSNLIHLLPLYHGNYEEVLQRLERKQADRE